MSDKHEFVFADHDTCKCGDRENAPSHYPKLKRITEEQRQHILNLSRHFESLMTSKYVAGAKEHGGNLWERDPLWLIDQAILENIDQFVYLVTARNELEEKLYRLKQLEDAI